VNRAAASFLSAVENTLDTLDGMDVVRGVVAIRDQALDEVGVLRSYLDARNSGRGDCGFDAMENTLLSQARLDVVTARCQAGLVGLTPPVRASTEIPASRSQPLLRSPFDVSANVPKTCGTREVPRLYR
jgi:hypothetical protein